MNNDKFSSELPISIYQKRFFLEWLMRPNDNTYNAFLFFKIEGDLKIPFLKKAIKQYVTENEIAHARYSPDGEVCYHGNYSIEDFYEESDIGSDDIESEINQRLNKIFDLTKGALTRFYLLKSKEAGKTVYHFLGKQTDKHN